ncbi:hypothetical protein J4E08_19875 [Sagittula sp. NFXS13]|uniref:Uncharacterized protein n=1 Tax=Sagittula marina TaxID=943940 RepID=A0A7W6GUI9_9RHOB|nr:hypothetical protein [Sagittula marina]MBB3988220.1 hypothetical protein [Sagittula marina]
MTFAELPAHSPVTLCPEVAKDLGRAVSVAADLDRTWTVWCGVCRLTDARYGRLGDVLEAWPLLARQELPKMGQRYERDNKGVWLLREEI